jgi:hypothetical protein
MRILFKNLGGGLYNITLSTRDRGVIAEFEAEWGAGWARVDREVNAFAIAQRNQA